VSRATLKISGISLKLYFLILFMSIGQLTTAYAASVQNGIFPIYETYAMAVVLTYRPPVTAPKRLAVLLINISTPSRVLN
jgi:hypothetical protein